ncbi:hypothetical protein D9M69_501540 [compost metagenome]
MTCCSAGCSCCAGKSTCCAERCRRARRYCSMPCATPARPPIHSSCMAACAWRKSPPSVANTTAPARCWARRNGACTVPGSCRSAMRGPCSCSACAWRRDRATGSGCCAWPGTSRPMRRGCRPCTCRPCASAASSCMHSPSSAAASMSRAVRAWTCCCRLANTCSSVTSPAWRSVLPAGLAARRRSVGHPSMPACYVPCRIAWRPCRPNAPASNRRRLRPGSRTTF